MSLPVYGAYRLLGGRPADERNGAYDIGLWAITVWSCAVPLAVLAVLIRRAAERVASGRGFGVAAGLVVGTLLLPFATIPSSHDLDALLGFSAWQLLNDRVTKHRLVLAGMLAGAAVAGEYPMVLVLAFLAVFLLYPALVELF